MEGGREGLQKQVKEEGEAGGLSEGEAGRLWKGVGREIGSKIKGKRVGGRT